MRYMGVEIAVDGGYRGVKMGVNTRVGKEVKMRVEMRKKIGVEMGVDEGRDGVDWVDGSRNGGMGVDTAIETRLMLATTNDDDEDDEDLKQIKKDKSKLSNARDMFERTRSSLLNNSNFKF